MVIDMTYTAATTKTTAQTILSQIPGYLRLALGMRDFMHDENTLYFRMTGTRAVRAFIRYNEGSDLYTVRCYTVRKFTETVRYEADMLDAQQVAELLDMMDRGIIEL